jgi:CheY-like chemotaxis protein
VLVVDDEIAIQRIIERILTAEGYLVLAPPTPEEALVLVARAELGIDLLITDVVMPGMSGPEFLERVRRLQPALPAIYISGYTRDLVDPLNTGGEELHLAKPFKPLDLLQAVSRALKVKPAATSLGRGA